MAWTPTSVAYGIRHARLFGFLGRAGEAIDAVIVLQGSGNVPRKCFTNIGWPDQVTALLMDNNDNYLLTFNIDGIILTIKIADVQMTVAQARDMFVDVVNTALRITNPSRHVNRVGIVETYDLARGAPGEIGANTLTRLADVGRPVDFSFRVAFRRPREPQPGDWTNTILQVAAVKSEDEEEELPDALRVSIDYQQYFSPEQIFSVKMIRDHYTAFYHEAESLQTNQLAGLTPPSQQLRQQDG
jgi:hypothetical protein